MLRALERGSIQPPCYHSPCKETREGLIFTCILMKKVTLQKRHRECLYLFVWFNNLRLPGSFLFILTDMCWLCSGHVFVRHYANDKLVVQAFSLAPIPQMLANQADMEDNGIAFLSNSGHGQMLSRAPSRWKLLFGCHGYTTLNVVCPENCHNRNSFQCYIL